MKYAMLVALMLSACTPAYSASLEVIEVKQPAACAVGPQAMPMPCALAMAMLNKMSSGCGGGCSGKTSCAVKVAP